MKELVSIVVPCYKQAHYLEQSLQSVLEQTYTNWECLIVNDGSPDNTEQIANKWCKKDLRFKYIFQENGGLSSARNKGISNASGSFILPLDADDLIHKNYLEKTVPILSSNEHLGIVSSYSKFFVDGIANVIFELKPKRSF